MPVFIAFCSVFYMYFADVPPDEPLGETDCCTFNVLVSILSLNNRNISRLRQACCRAL